MPSRLDAPVLTVDIGPIHNVDTRNGENLHKMWSTFSRCASSLEEGPRLENLGWRLWNCCNLVSEANATTPAISIASTSSEEALGFESDHTSASTPAPPLDISCPHIVRRDSINNRCRGRERHITPDNLEKMVITIKEKKDLEPLSLNTQFNFADESKIDTTIPETTTSSMESQSSTDNAFNRSAQPASTDSASSALMITSVVKGFSPLHVSSSYRSITALSSISTTDFTDAPASERTQPKKKQVFALGGSSGKGSLPNSIDNKQANEDESHFLYKQYFTENKEQTPNKEKFDGDVFESDEDEIDESAINDDDDCSDWEDSVEDSGNASINEKTFFQRVDSRPNLISRRSLITTMLQQYNRANPLVNATTASKSTLALRSRKSVPNGPLLAASPDSDDAAPHSKPISKIPRTEIPRSAARPIIQTTTNTTLHQQVLSPRTTRRNMLASELTVSLRQHLLWERKQKSQTANAVLKRRHTAHDVANLKQYPEKVHVNREDKESNKLTWNEYYGQGLGEYHSRGW